MNRADLDNLIPQQATVAAAGQMVDLPVSPPANDAPSESSKPTVYKRTLDACVPRLLGILGSSNGDDTWDMGGAKCRTADRNSFRRQAAAAALANLVELDPQRDDGSFILGRVRAAIIRWQLTLHRSGHPLHRLGTDNASQLATAGYVIHTLSETGRFQSNLLMQDLKHHLAWLARQRTQSAWAGAAIVAALADGAVLLRDNALHREARTRLGALLKRQDEEGWFPEHGGVDLGYLSLTIDALARAHAANGWDEIIEPARRALRFMTHFVHPDGSYGGCYSAFGAGFLSPYGVEMLSQRIPEAATLAAVCRKRFASACPERIAVWNGDLCAVLAASLAMTRAQAHRAPLTSAPLPHESRGSTLFPNAGMMVVSTDSYHAVTNAKKGGALHVTWRNEEESLSDPGITVLFPRKLRVSGRWDRRCKARLADRDVSVRGILGKASIRPRPRFRRALRRAVRWLVDRVASMLGTAQGESWPAKPSNRHLTHDHFVREIHLTEDAVRIDDFVECRLPCESVLFHAPLVAKHGPMLDHDLSALTAHAPRMVTGGRNVGVSRVYRGGRLIRSTRH